MPDKMAEMMHMHKTVANIRKAMQGELGAINEYHEFAMAAETPEMHDLFHHIAMEEKRHLAEEFRALLMLDPEQMQAYRDVFGGKKD
ncbi:MAG: ferritin family protein [Chitinophagales bacterium]